MAPVPRLGRLQAFLHGLLSAVSLHKCIPLFFLSRKASLRTLQCFMLNGVMFIGSVTLADALVLPAIDWYRSRLHIDAEAYATTVWVVTTGAMLMFQLFWFLPMYCISLILSARWCNDIASEASKHAFDPTLQPAQASQQAGTSSRSTPTSTAMYFSEILQPKRVPRMDIVVLVMEELYRFLLVLVLLVQVALLAFIPVIGNVLSFLLCCFVYSFYSFEYKWAMDGTPLMLRMRHLEERWLFLLGFGAPFTLATFSFSFWISGGLYSLLFPINIMLASVTRPCTHTGPPASIPIFQIPTRAALLVMRVLAPLLGAGRGQQKDDSAGSTATRRSTSSTTKPSALRGRRMDRHAGNGHPASNAHRQRVRFDQRQW